MKKYVELTREQLMTFKAEELVDAYEELLTHHITETSMLITKLRELREERKHANTTGC